MAKNNEYQTTITNISDSNLESEEVYCQKEKVKCDQLQVVITKSNTAAGKYWGSVILYSSRTAIAVCMPHMAEEFQWDKKQQGLILSCFLWGYPVTQVFGGYMADKIGGAKVIMLAGVGWTGITFLTPIILMLGGGDATTSLLLMICSRMAQGVLQGNHYPAAMSVISNHVREAQRTYVFSIVGSGTHGGTLCIGLFGSVIVETFGWRYVFYAVGLLGLWWVMLLRRSTEEERSTINAKEEVAAAPKLPWNVVVKKAPFWAMLIAHFAQGYTYFVFLFWLPTFFHDNYHGAPPWIYNVLPWLIDMVVTMLVGKLAEWMLSRNYSKTYTRKSLNIFAMLLFGACLISISFSSSFETTLFIICLAAAGHGFYQSTVIMNPNDITPKHSGFMFGVMNTFGAIPGFIGTYVSGAILQSTNSWGLMYSITGWITVIGWAVFAYFGSGKPIL